MTLWPLPHIEAYGEISKRPGDKMYDINTQRGYILIIYYDDNMIKSNARQEMSLKIKFNRKNNAHIVRTIFLVWHIKGGKIFLRIIQIEGRLESYSAPTPVCHLTHSIIAFVLCIKCSTEFLPLRKSNDQNV